MAQSRRFGLKPGEVIPLTGKVISTQDSMVAAALFEKAKQRTPPLRLRIAGILADDPTWGTSEAFADIGHVRNLAVYDSVDFLVTAQGLEDKERVARGIGEALKDHPEAVVQTRERVIANLLSRGTDPLLAAVVGVVGLVLLIGVMSVVNTQSANILERRRELGLLRAVGLTRRRLRRMIVMESSLLGLLGALPGVGAASLLSGVFVLGFRGQGASFIPYSFPLPVASLVALTALLAGLLAGYLAARKVTDAAIRDALQYE